MSQFFLQVGQKAPARGTRIGRYVVNELLVETNCSYICLAFDSDTGQKKILKIVTLNNNDEINLVRQLSHSNIIRFDPIVDAPPFHMIPMDYYEYGSVLDLLMNCSDYQNGFPEQMARDIFYQMASALHYLHQQNIWHRDIKPDNILIGQLQPPKAYLSDFGFAKRIPSGVISESDQFVGTPEYAPREIHEHVSYGAYSDIYSLGVTLFVMLTGRLPLPLPPPPNQPDVNHFYRKLSKGRFAYSLLEQKGMNSAVDLIKGMCNPEPSKRLTAEQVLMHEWVQSAVKSTPESEVAKIIFPDMDDFAQT